MIAAVPASHRPPGGISTRVHPPFAPTLPADGHEVVDGRAERPSPEAQVTVTTRTEDTRPCTKEESQMTERPERHETAYSEHADEGEAPHGPEADPA